MKSPDILPRHTFHVPVMGIGFTLDSAIKVAHQGVTTTLSLADDILIEKLRVFYCKKNKIPFTPIPDTTEDYRARRITAWLNLVNQLVSAKFDKLKRQLADDRATLKDYLSAFPLSPEHQLSVSDFVDSFRTKEEIAGWLAQHISCGSIDVNIMTKLDKPNYADGKKLPREYNDAHAALRGFANSELQAGVVFSAGFNPNLFTYLESFPDFYPDSNGRLKKKIILKVSDYRSALVHGMFFAKKGLWISEYRIESGLYCGGHLFPTQGVLMGPILEEFKSKHAELFETLYPIYMRALNVKNITANDCAVNIRITAQGGVSTAAEHQFLMKQYRLSSVGWGTPFLLVPEVSNVDMYTLELLINAGKQDVCVSDISPLNVPFTNLKYNSKDLERDIKISNNMPGSLCPKKYLSFNTEFGENELCVASRDYQEQKVKQLQEMQLPPDQYEAAYEKIVVKSCICVGLGTSALLVNRMNTREEGKGVSICPSPNIAFFNKTISLQRMIDHIYGKASVLDDEKVPHVFVRELEAYIDYLQGKIAETQSPTAKQTLYFWEFRENLMEGIRYYRNLFKENNLTNALDDLKILENRLISGVNPPHHE
jgi:hypothetical protein